MTLPAIESMRPAASWHGLFDRAMKVCDKYYSPRKYDILIFSHNSELAASLKEGLQCLN